MKLGGATPMRGFVLGLLPLMGASMKTMKEIGQALSMGGSFFDQGLGGDDLNLQVIESSLMSMVREGTSPSLLPGIMAIFDLTTDMKAAVENKSNHEQANLTKDWYIWLNCTANPGDRIENPFPVTPIHDQCFDNRTSWQNDWDGNRYYGDILSWHANICRQNCTETCEITNEITRELCPQTPFSCEKQWAAFDTNTDVRAHMLYLQSKFAENMANESNCSSSRNVTNCTTQCITECPPGGNTSWANCSISACVLQNEGCMKHNESCFLYNECYDTEQQDYNVTKTWVSEYEYSNKQEYRAILRIECLLHAFNSSIANESDLSDGIDACINTTFNIDDQTFFGPVTIGYYNESENPRKACTAENFPGAVPSFGLVPGSPAWNQIYFEPYILAGFEPPDCGDPIYSHYIPDCIVPVPR